jgi:O-Antigen ligase
MFDLLTKEKKIVFWVIFHFILGILCVVTKFAYIGWMYLIYLSFAIDLLNKGKGREAILYLLMYEIGAELLGRMSKAQPFVPYESGKYISCLLFVLGIFAIKGKRSAATAAVAMLILSLPSLFVLPDNWDWLYNIVFNYFGLLNMALGLWYFSRVSYSDEEIMNALRIAVYGIIGILGFLTLKTGSVSDIKFELTANFETSGGFGSNQVSTILGVGFAIIGFCFLTNKVLLRYRALDILFFLLFLFRAILTFSRGGVVVGVLVLFLAAIYFTAFASKSKFRSFRTFNLGRLIFSGIAILAVFMYVNALTGDSLLKRYQGETYATNLGLKKQTYSGLTSGRFDIFLTDLRIFADYPMFGVGPGESSKKRADYGFVRSAAHIEVSRLLSEHGVFGIFIAIIMFFFPVSKVLSSKDSYLTGFRILFFGIAIFTTFHSALRTVISPVLWGLASTDIILFFTQRKKVVTNVSAVNSNPIRATV